MTLATIVAKHQAVDNNTLLLPQPCKRLYAATRYNVELLSKVRRANSKNDRLAGKT